MSKGDKSKPSASSSADTVKLAMSKTDDPDLKMAEAMIAPYITNAFAFSKSTRGTAGELELDKLVTAMIESAKRVREGNLKDVEGMLITQATVLNGIFADLVCRSSMNRSEGYFDASQAYMKLAFKAQNQCRMTLETLSAIKYPPVVYAQQANIAHGPQQVNNDILPSTHPCVKLAPENKLFQDSDKKMPTNEEPDKTPKNKTPLQL